MRISSVVGREVLDSRGYPTVEAVVHIAGGYMGSAIVPSGASTGTHEAVELRDNQAGRYMGRGVRGAIANINDIIGPQVTGHDADDQQGIDQLMIELDGTSDKSKLGANAILAVSLATARAAAAAQGAGLYRYLGGDDADVLPVPLMNVINGGKHADNGLDMQEFMLVPAGRPTFSEALRCGVEVYHELRRRLIEGGLSVAVGDEGGFAPRLQGNERALQLLVGAIEGAGYRPGEDVWLALDPAATEFYRDGVYCLDQDGVQLDAGEMVDLYRRWCERYPVVSIEDGLAEDDWEGWAHLTRELGGVIQIVGDDLFVTNMERLQRGIEGQVANSVLVKMNQIGTITETLGCIDLAHNAGYTAVVSHRSGETEDTGVADVAVCRNAGQIKTGAPCRGERVCKYNRLLRIEQELALPRFLGISGIARSG